MKLFEWLYGLMFLVAFMEFTANPKKALQDTYCTMVAPAPRISADGSRMYFPKNSCGAEEPKKKTILPRRNGIREQRSSEAIIGGAFNRTLGGVRPLDWPFPELSKPMLLLTKFP